MKFNKFFPYIIAIIIFMMASLLYFHPVLKGQKIAQSDITQFNGMAQEIVQYRAENNDKEPYWTGASFSGMPAYQVSAYYPNDYVRVLDRLLRFLPRPADYTFLYFLSFFVLMMALKVKWRLAILGALSFGFSTYLIIIFVPGHNSKAHAIAYMPLVLAGVLWVFQRKYVLGFIVTGLAMALEIYTNHIQMTYYLGFCLLILGFVEFVNSIKKEHRTKIIIQEIATSSIFFIIYSYKEGNVSNYFVYGYIIISLAQLVVYFIINLKNNNLQIFIKQGAVIMAAVLLGIGANSPRLMATKEYAEFSTRGKSELTIKPDGTKKEVTTGLDKDYITQYSYAKLETFNLFIPRFMGGGTVEELSDNSNFYQLIKSKAGKKVADDYSQRVLTYWGDQPIIEAPAYIGAVVFFLFFLGIFLVKGRLKQWLVATTVFAIILSWGRNFEIITNLFIDYVPLYNKFRAVSSIQVIAELCVPILAILALKELFSSNNSKEIKLEAIKKAAIYFGGLIVLGFLLAHSFSTFEGIRDANYNDLPGLIDALIADRKAMLLADTIRSLVLMLLAAGTLWFFLQDKLKKLPVILVFTTLILFDLISVDKKYVSKDEFKPSRRIEKPFTASNADLLIMQDTTHFRVGNFIGNPMEDGSTSYFHQSIGGYHAAKMGRYSELFEYQIAKNNMEVLNMLNTKYFIVPGKNGEKQAQLNEQANGNVWFVNKVLMVNSANEEIKALDSLDTKNVAVLNSSKLENDIAFDFKKDSIATIKLLNYDVSKLKYQSQSEKKQFAVFSEIYYKDGWNAYIDGELVPHYQVNYVLRGMEIPEGKHTIEFKFEPKVIQQGSIISISSYFLLIIVAIGWLFYDEKKKKRKKQIAN